MLDARTITAVLAEIGDHVAAFGRSEAALLARLRAQFGGAHFSLCADDDVPPGLSPAAGNSLCRLYYVATVGHCLQLTSDADAASGLLVAWTEEEGA